MKICVVLWTFLVQVTFGQFILPNKRACDNRKIHLEKHGKKYHFSWLEVGENRKFEWEDARNYCRRFCMDSISITSAAEWQTVKDTLRQYRLRYIWTGGRKCNFKGCDRPDLTPNIVNGWFWAARRTKIEPKNKCNFCDWSNTGGSRIPQPDNREQREGGEDEACIAVLNNFYADGIRWHDVACSHKKPIICEEIQELVNFAENN